MGRRSFISTSTIRRITAAANRIEREKYNKELINSQGGNEKERPPKFSISNVEFNIDTRVARIEILQTQEYRTIQKYVTQNYVKYPIYSEWKIKQKIIKKTIKLTNLALEQLILNDDELIRMLADDIVIKLNNEELFPSWFLKKYLKIELDSDLNTMRDNLKTLNGKQKKKIFAQQKEINCYDIEINMLNKKLFELENKKKKKNYSLKKILIANSNILNDILYIGIYKYLISHKRKLKIKSQLYNINGEILKVNTEIYNNKNKIEECKKIINNCKINISENEKKYKVSEENRLNEYIKKISEVKPLSKMISQDDNFTMLKLFSGLEYEKIIGVYVIHNKENDKYYVGQSKDVMKRIKQHFNGTVPRNQIFAEDYYTSKIENKNNLFEIKIIKCETKDELDKLEKKLIYEYDSWNNGYNGTSGNI